MRCRAPNRAPSMRVPGTTGCHFCSAEAAVAASGPLLARGRPTMHCRGSSFSRTTGASDFCGTASCRFCGCSAACYATRYSSAERCPAAARCSCPLAAPQLRAALPPHAALSLRATLPLRAAPPLSVALLHTTHSRLAVPLARAAPPPRTVPRLGIFKLVVVCLICSSF